MTLSFGAKVQTLLLGGLSFSKLSLFQTKIKTDCPESPAKPTEMRTWDLMKWKLIQDRKLSWSDVLKMMATRNYIMKLCIKQSFPSLSHLQMCGFVKEHARLLQKMHQKQHSLQSQTTKMVYIRCWLRQNQKYFILNLSPGSVGL